MEIEPTVLTVNRVAHLGGVERVILDAAQAVSRRGFRPVLACPAPGRLADEMARRGLRVRPAPIARGKATLSPLGVVRAIAAFRRGGEAIGRIAREEGAAVLHAHHPVVAVQALGAAAGTPLLLHVHETLPMPRLYAALVRRVRARCAMWVCVSEASRALVRSLGVPEERTRLVYNGVGPVFMGEAPPPAAELCRPGPHVGIFGVIEPRKGHAHFLRALALLGEQFPHAQGWVVGAPGFAEGAAHLQALRRLAGELGLGERVHFPGHRDDVAALMAGMDAVVLASTGFESLPTVLIEACALGRPTVATAVGGVREIVRDGETGLVVPPADAPALARAMGVALSPAGAALGARARADARRRFAPDRFGDDLAACYRDLVGAGKADRAHGPRRAA